MNISKEDGYILCCKWWKTPLKAEIDEMYILETQRKMLW